MQQVLGVRDMYMGEREERATLRQTYMLQGYSYEEAGKLVDRDMGSEDFIGLICAVGFIGFIFFAILVVLGDAIFR